MIPTIRPSIKQHQAYEILKDNSTDFTHLLFGGGAGGGKSWFGGEWQVTHSIMYPETRWFIGRSELKRLRNSTLVTFYKLCKHHGIENGHHFKYDGKDNFIQFYNGSRIDLLDLRYLPSDPLYERYGSQEYTGGWIEEGGEVNFGAYDTLKSRIGRHLNDHYGLNSKLLITCNPKKNWLYPTFYKPFRDNELPTGMYFIQSLVDDNPYGEKRYKQNLLNITDKAKRERLLYGNWEYDDDPNWLIDDYDKLLVVFNNKMIITGNKYITCDAARFGSDKAIILVWEGMKVIDYKTYAVSKTTEIADGIKAFQEKHGVQSTRVVIDADGVGGGVADLIDDCKQFINNSSPLKIEGQKEEFDNLKSQCAFKLAEVINDEKLAIRCKITEKDKEDIKEELEQLKRADHDFKQKLVSKDTIKQNIGRSPDWMDSLLMRMFFELKEENELAIVW
jgi:hypothetical protein